MAGEYNGLCREREKLRFDPAYEGKFVSTVEVAATAAPGKNDIAWEKERRYVILSVYFARIFAEKCETAGGVPCNVNYL